jgi:hypothetical protein
MFGDLGELFKEVNGERRFHERMLKYIQKDFTDQFAV